MAPSPATRRPWGLSPLHLGFAIALIVRGPIDLGMPLLLAGLFVLPGGLRPLLVPTGCFRLLQQRLVAPEEAQGEGRLGARDRE